MDLHGNDIYFTALDLSTPMKIQKNGLNLTTVGPERFSQLSEVKVVNNNVSHTGQTNSNKIFVRLLGNGDATRGQVEFFANGRWGTACNIDWDNTNAQVVCHMLGFDRDRAQKYPNMAQKNSMLSLNAVHCSGQETHIDDCDISPNICDLQHCHQGYDVGVLCETEINSDYQIDNFLIFCNGSSGELIRMDLTSFSYTKLSVTAVVNCSAVVFHPFDQHFYFYSVNKVGNFTEIYALNQRENTIREVKKLPGRSVNGLSIDFRRNMLFYSDSVFKDISSLLTNGFSERSLTSMVEEPNDIAVDRISSEVFWTSGGSSPMIRKVPYGSTGSYGNLAYSGLKNPTGIAIDPIAKLVYFCDSGTHNIEVMNTDGANRKVLFTDYSSHFSGLAITSKYIFYTDLNKRHIMRLDRDGSNHLTVGPPDFLHLTKIHAYEALLH
ncbi:hypothetical protein Btru_050127 [Bulinus truncatus]|nr:hypothetical protein Btru_050127 [Bulinus truncatus]